MDKKRTLVTPAGIGAQPDTHKADSAAKIPYASEDSVEAARNWVNEHEL